MNAVATAPFLKTSHRCGPNATATPLPNLFPRQALPQVAIRRKSLVPNVGLEPAPSCEDRILSPVRLPYSWYWKHVAVMLKGFDCKTLTIPPTRIGSPAVNSGRIWRKLSSNESYIVHGEFKRGERATSKLLAGFAIDVTSALTQNR